MYSMEIMHFNLMNSIKNYMVCNLYSMLIALFAENSWNRQWDWTSGKRSVRTVQVLPNCLKQTLQHCQQTKRSAAGEWLASYTP